MEPQYNTNDLIEETSPYLLQHAHNPVDWKPWGEEAFAKAEAEDKLVLVSIGYSSCHWCHVMEREAFEDEEVAALMNHYFVPIKVDREERPDVDEAYMTAVQLMTQQGGWPLNCFTLPDKRPIFGGTYFPKDTWKDVLRQLAAVYKDEPEKVFEYADRLTQGVKEVQLIQPNKEEKPFAIKTLDTMVGKWSNQFDQEYGGPSKAPKFPVPNNYQFLLRYGKLTEDEAILDHVKLTLDQMAFGGIYDQLGGGFSRYSTDRSWKVPHFEKMLYDNAQLVSLYADAYRQTDKKLYKSIIEDTLSFVEREMFDHETGGFYSAIDADSEQEEGKFYVWTEMELREGMTEEEYNFIRDHYNVNEVGKWEKDKFILLRKKPDEELAKEKGMQLHVYRSEVEKVRKKLFEARVQRIRPETDDKSITSWNAMMLKGFVDGYRTLGDAHYLEMARQNATFLLENQFREDGGLYRTFREGKPSVHAYLEDHALVMEAFIALYEATFEEDWLQKAQALMEVTIKHFLHEETGMFYYTSKEEEEVLSRSYNIMDNVLPSSNSVMVRNLFYLGHYFDKEDWLEMSSTLLQNVQDKLVDNGPQFSNWGILMLHHIFPFHETAIVGKEALEYRKAMDRHFLPNQLLLGSTGKGKLPLLDGKGKEGETMVYVCHEKVCEAPVGSVEEAVE